MVTINTPVSACPECQKPRTTKFCSDCGVEITTLQIPNHQLKVAVSDILREFPNQMQIARNTAPGGGLPGQAQNTDLWIPVQSHSFARLFRTRGSRPAFITPSADSVKEELQQFRTHFQQVIEALVQAYGEKNVVFGWGVMAFLV
jgi:hypothetical protein